MKKKTTTTIKIKITKIASIKIKTRNLKKQHQIHKKHH
jgi:hypothetical protein